MGAQGGLKGFAFGLNEVAPLGLKGFAFGLKTYILIGNGTCQLSVGAAAIA